MDVLLTIGGAIITGLLVIIAYFLKEMHSDFKYMRCEMGEQGERLVRTETEMKTTNSRLSRIEKKIFA